MKKLGIEEAIRCCGVPGIHHTIKEPTSKLPSNPVDAVIQVMKPTPLPDHARARLQAKVKEVFHPEFNEADCGGAFDGFQVTSDADPGL